MERRNIDMPSFVDLLVNTEDIAAALRRGERVNNDSIYFNIELLCGLYIIDLAVLTEYFTVDEANNFAWRLHNALNQSTNYTARMRAMHHLYRNMYYDRLERKIVHKHYIGNRDRFVCVNDVSCVDLVNIQQHGPGRVDDNCYSFESLILVLFSITRYVDDINIAKIIQVNDADFVEPLKKRFGIYFYDLLAKLNANCEKRRSEFYINSLPLPLQTMTNNRFEIRICDDNSIFTIFCCLPNGHILEYESTHWGKLLQCINVLGISRVEEEEEEAGAYEGDPNSKKYLYDSNDLMKILFSQDHTQNHTKLFVALTIAGFLICGFGLFMMLTNYIVFNFINIVAPCIAGVGFALAIISLIKTCCDCCVSSNSCSDHKAITPTDETHNQTTEPLVDATDLSQG
jgi:hypothetical protein